MVIYKVIYKVQTNGPGSTSFRNDLTKTNYKEFSKKDFRAKKAESATFYFKVQI